MRESGLKIVREGGIQAYVCVFVCSLCACVYMYCICVCLHVYRQYVCVCVYIVRVCVLADRVCVCVHTGLFECACGVCVLTVWLKHN